MSAAKITLILCVLLISSAGYSQPTGTMPDSASVGKKGEQLFRLTPELTYAYKKPGGFDFIKKFPGDMKAYARRTFARENLLELGIVALATALTIYYDQEILDETQRFGDSIGLNGNNRLKTAFKVFGLPIELPHDPDTWLYFIGDGWTHTGITAGFLTYGLIGKNNRALQVASQLAQGLATAGFTSQLLKHVTGRESPHVATVKRGRWRFFPNQIEYHKHVPEYDAFPSGHLAVSMMTITVISDNYPRSKIVKPLGFTLMALLSFEMVNNGVHWISDYPLAIAMGYSFGKIAVAQGRRLVRSEHPSPSPGATGPEIGPYVGPRGIGLRLNF